MECMSRARSTGRQPDGGQADVRSPHRSPLEHTANQDIRTVFNAVADASDRPYSHVVITTKAIPDVTTTTKLLAPLLTAPYADLNPQPTYVFIQNGLDAEKDVYEAIKALGKGEPKIISTALYIAANLVEGNVVNHGDFVRVSLHSVLAKMPKTHIFSQMQDNMQIGVYRYDDCHTTTNSPTEIDILNDFSSMLLSAGSSVKIQPEIQRIKFAKNLWNVVYGGYSTLTNYRLPSIFREPPPAGSSLKYEPYRSPTTSELIKTQTIPSMKKIFQELINLGKLDSGSSVSN
jgi:2-dehydropantoate 2-reductase